MTINKIDAFAEKIENFNWKNEKYINNIFNNLAIRFDVPKHKDKVTLSINETNEDFDVIMSTDFCSYEFINGFEAVWSKNLNTIECEIEFENSLIFPSYILLLIKNIFEEKNESTPLNIDNEFKTYNNEEIKLKTEEGIELSFGICSNEFKTLYSMKSRTLFKDLKSIFTFKIKNLELTNHDDALKKLLKISNSLFFEIIYILNIGIKLKHESTIAQIKINEAEKLIEKSKLEISNLTSKRILKNGYDNEPMSLYLHGRINSDFPLYKYLSLYQSIEYYFPTYSANEAKERIKRVLKEPGFDPDNNAKLTKLLSAVKINRTGDIGDEKTQLKNTLRNCISNEELEEFLTENKELADYFKGSKGKEISRKNIQFTNKDFDVKITSISERIYDIRCRIVHKKVSDNSNSLILPYSLESDFIKFEISLINFIAENVLIKNSYLFN